ncbi:MAG: TonB-dependent receptor [Bacteroidetes bacterium]|nr:TonB-dependent receptor [Bacteroidota bacterium]
MNRKYVAIILFFVIVSLCIKPVFSQVIYQNIRGKVLDKENNNPLNGATVKVISLNKGTTIETSASTNSSGNFSVENVPVGRCSVKVTYTGYITYVMPDLLIDASKEVVLEIGMKESITLLGELVVSEEQPNKMESVSSNSITVEQTQRFPATFSDLARAATAFPGVVNTDDQTNLISVRGNTPNGLLWRLEGVDIVSPNHLGNAGTFSDRMTQSGGGVNILSTQLLANSTFLTGAFSSSYGNALSGILDMKLRKGNNQRHEFIGQLGLIGADFAAEGPVNKKNGSSYLVNYRYSTMGLLSAMGINLGDEKIAFQDLSFNLSFLTKKAGDFTFFGMGGLSSNLFKAQRDSLKWVYQKDRFDIDYYSKMGASGIAHTIILAKNSFLKTALSLSAVESSRTGDLLNYKYIPTNIEYDKILQRIFSFTTSFNHKFSAASYFVTGIFVNRLYYDLSSKEGTAITNPVETINGKQGSQLIQPYFNWKYTFLKNLTLNSGLHFMLFTFNQSQALEPRMSLRWEKNKQSINLAYGLHSQLQLPAVYFTSDSLPGGTRVNPNKNLDFTRAHHIVFGYTRLFSSNLKLNTEIYYQYLFNVPIVNKAFSSFSVLNELEGIVTDTLVNKGTGENYGLEISLTKQLSGNYYFLLSSSLYNSTYKGGDGIKRNTRYNGTYAFNFTGGKEIPWNKNGKNRVFGVNAEIIYMGGLRYTPINGEASAIAEKTIYQESKAFSKKLPDDYKLNIRLSLKKNKVNYTRTIALDIQNVTSRKNIAFQYYDFQKKEIVTKYHLGIIPILTYRVEF